LIRGIRSVAKDTRGAFLFPLSPDLTSLFDQISTIVLLPPSPHPTHAHARASCTALGADGAKIVAEVVAALPALTDLDLR
jgi:hypothetical protein